MRLRNLRYLTVRRETKDPALWGSDGTVGYQYTETQGWIQPLSATTRAKLAPPPGSELPVPAYVAYLVPSAPVQGSGVVLLADGLIYHPTGLARDTGGVGHHIELFLTAPAALEVVP